MAIPAAAAEVLEFWFGPEPDDATAAEQRHALWYTGSKGGDAEIRDRFGTLLTGAEAGELDNWHATPRGSLALVILFDQFSRNIYRGSPRAFSNDARALQIARRMVDEGTDRQLAIVERAFLYHAFEHDEALANQDLSVRLFEQLHQDAPPALQPLAAGFLDFARQHRDIIRAFGRYPHRNRILGRTSTPEETAYIEGGGKTFGQQADSEDSA